MTFTLSSKLMLARPTAAPRSRRSVQAQAAKCPFSFFSSNKGGDKRPAPPAASASPAAVDPASLYARLGGEDAVYAVTSELFDRLLVDEHLGHFFEADTLPKHKKIVASFIASAVGGDKPYKGRSMVDAHLGLVDLQYPRDFNIVAETLQAVLNDVGVPAELSAELMAVVGTLAPQFEKVARVRKALDAGEL